MGKCSQNKAVEDISEKIKTPRLYTTSLLGTNCVKSGILEHYDITLQGTKKNIQRFSTTSMEN